MSDSTLFYDKPLIITRMRTVMQRLRNQHIFVPELIHLLAHRGVLLKRQQFDDMFLTRAHRDVFIPHHDFQQLIAVLFDVHAHILSADEFIQLAIAIRLPIDQFHHYKHYFSNEDWQATLYAYGFQPQQQGPVRSIFGRDTILNRLFAVMAEKRHIVLTGPAGIGKTAIALELLRRYEMMHGQPIYYLDMRHMQTMAQCFAQVAALFGVKPLHNEPPLLRLQMVIQKTHFYVLLDNVDEIAESLSAATLLKQLQTHLPTLSFLVTTRDCDAAYARSAYHVESIPALDTTHQRSAACQLFTAIYQQAGGGTLDPAYVWSSCQAVHGNPLAIGMIASAVAAGHGYGATDDVVRQTIATMSHESRQLVTLVSMVPHPMTRRLLRLLATHMWQMNPSHYHELLTDLSQRRMMYVVGDDDDARIEVHAVIRQVIRHTCTPDEFQQVLGDMARTIGQLDLCWEDARNSATELLVQRDIATIIACVELLLAHQRHADAAHILVYGRAMWIRHGFGESVTLLVEECLTAFPSPHVLAPHILYTLGTLYGSRGMHSLALRYLQNAYTAALQHQHMPLACRIVAELGMNAVVDTNTPPTISVDTMQQYFATAFAYLITQSNMQLSASVYDVYAYVCAVSGNIPDALAYNQQALELYTQHDAPSGLLEAHFNRGLILLACGEYATAVHHLTQAKAGYAQLQIPLGMAQCNLRLAGIATLRGDQVHGRVLLSEALAQLYRSGGTQDILFVMDIYSGLLMHNGLFHDTLQLCDLIESYRAERRLFRGHQLDILFHSQRQIAQHHPVGDRTPMYFHPQMTFYHVLQVICDDLLRGE